MIKANRIIFNNTSYINWIKGVVTLSILFFTLNNNSLAQNTNRPLKEAKGLPIGASITEFSAKDINGSTYSITEALKKGAVVLVFIRGQWCPYCNKHMSELQDSSSLIYKKGANIVVISPEKPDFIKKTIEKTGSEFTILYDEGYKISDAFDVTFKPDAITLFKYNSIPGSKFKNSHSDDSERIPIPATFIIDKTGKIVWRHFNPDYKKRSTIAEILNNIPVK